MRVNVQTLELMWPLKFKVLFMIIQSMLILAMLFIKLKEPTQLVSL